MAEDWNFTPPSSPSSNNIEESEPLVEVAIEQSDIGERMFDCMGEVTADDISFHAVGYYSSNDLSTFHRLNEKDLCADDEAGQIELFGYSFDKGGVVLFNFKSLFFMARQALNKINEECAARASIFGRNANVESVDCKYERENITRYLIFLRNYLRRLSCCEKWSWIFRKIFDELAIELYLIRQSLDEINEIPDYILNNSHFSSGNMCSLPSYHKFHCELDVRWLHLTLLYEMAYYRENSSGHVREVCEYSQLTFSSVENQMISILDDLLLLSLKKFRKMNKVELFQKSMYNCSCIREFWKLISETADTLHSRHGIRPFWKCFNEAMEHSSCNNSGAYNCSDKISYVLWTLHNVVPLYRGNEAEISKNYEFLEIQLKNCLSCEVEEANLRVYLRFTECILLNEWGARSEPLLLLWEYFQKRMNKSFYTASSDISTIAKISKTGTGLLNQMNELLNASRKEMEIDSFSLFLRLLGKTLRLNPKCWNQVKGRIFSKFSSSKLATFDETGLYHFVSLLLILSISADIVEVGNKLNTFLKSLPTYDIRDSRVPLIWKARVAIILLRAERNVPILSGNDDCLLQMVETSSAKKDRFDSLMIFVEGFRDAIDSTSNLELGQYYFVGPWISSFLSQCNNSHAYILIDALYSLAKKLEISASNYTPEKSESQLPRLYDAFVENVVPYLIRMRSSNNAPEAIVEMAVILTRLSLHERNVVANNGRKHALEIFNGYVLCPTTNIRFLCRYLCKMCRFFKMNKCNITYDLSLIKGWMRCITLSNRDDNLREDLSVITDSVVNLSEIKQLQNDVDHRISSSTDYFSSLVHLLELKWNYSKDFSSKERLRDQVNVYFADIDRSVSCFVKDPSSAENTLLIYKRFGLLFEKIPHLLYAKSKPNTLLQCLLDILLMPIQVRKHEYTLNSYISSAICSTIHHYVRGLNKLGFSSDLYVSRCVRDLITIYVPRFSHPNFALLTIFSNEKEAELACFIADSICNIFFKRRSKIPHEFSYQALTFVRNVLKNNGASIHVVRIIIDRMLERICDVAMFCENTRNAKKEASNVIRTILDSQLLLSNPSLGQCVVDVFGKICKENLAFSSAVIFDLLEDATKHAPDLVSRFLPILVAQVNDVECKRQVAFDPSLRKGISRIETALNNLRSM